MADQNEWIGVTEACKLLGISNMTLYKLVDQGILPAYRIRGVKAMQFKRTEVLSLIERVQPRRKRSERGTRKS